MGHPPLVEAMLRPAFYPHNPQRVELVETHISWVFLTGQYAYKVKKPVDFGFLDFTTLERRRHFSEEEIRLNRRLSPEIYLGVLEIKERYGRFSLGGEGKVVEVAVWMKELPRRWRLDERLARGEVGVQDLEGVAEKLAAFFREARTDARIGSFGRPEKVMVNIRENFEQTEPFIDRTISRDHYEALRDYSYGFLREREELFLKRVDGGFVREGHGDLHTENIYLGGGEIYVLDCIEFNERFRFGDTASDIAFLLMDLEAKGYTTEAWQFLNGYLQFSGDYGMIQLLRFYKIYRAYVRGKIASFELEAKGREAAERARRYFELAWRYLTECRPGFVIATCGVMGSGKSTLAREVASGLGAVLIRSDAMRKHSLGIDPREHRYEPFGRGIYSPEATERTYRRMIEEAEGVLRAGYPVVLDASFAKETQRLLVRELASRLGVPHLFLWTVCLPEVIAERLASRSGDISDGRLELLDEHISSFEEPRGEDVLRVDTSLGLDYGHLMKEIEGHIGRDVLEKAPAFH